jgi:hypothetical protein
LVPLQGSALQAINQTLLLSKISGPELGKLAELIPEKQLAKRHLPS